MSPITFNLYGLLTDIRTIIEPLAEQKHIAVVFDFPSAYETHYFYADEFRLRQVLLNIVNNALKFTSVGEISLKTTILSKNETQVQVNITVTDTGIGIPPDKLDKVFEVFEQADSSIARKHGGSGLGLAICKQIIEIMQGTIYVKEHLPHGSEFCIELLLQKTEPSVSREQLVPVVTATARHNGRILVAEDNDVNILYITSLLEESGCPIDTVLSGQEALLALSKQKYEIILMDIHMPDMDGITAAKEIRSQGITTPIIIISADLSSRTLKKVTQFGINDFLGKPYTRKELATLLRKYNIILNSQQHAVAHKNNIRHATTRYATTTVPAGSHSAYYCQNASIA